MIAVVLCALALAVAGLRHSVRGPGAEETGEREEQAETAQAGRTSTYTEPRVIELDEREALKNATPTKINRMPPGEQKEDFDTQLLRAAGDSSVRGIVTGDDRKPLAGATVQLYGYDPMSEDPPLREAITDADGSFTLTRLTDGDIMFIIVARAQGYAPEAGMIRLVPGPPAQRDFHLERGVELSGVVRDATTSATLPDTTVYYPSKSGIIFRMLGTVRSNGAGRFTFPCVEEGSGKVLAEHEGYHSATKTLRAPDKEAEIAMMPGGATIRGVTISRLTRKPEGGAKVMARTEGLVQSVMSKDDGTFEFKDMPGGEYRLQAVKGIPSEVTKITLADREVREGIEIMLASKLFVTGKVVHAYSGKPLPAVRVYYQGPLDTKKSVLSDDDGLFGFETMALDNYTLEVHEKNFLPYFDARTTQSVEKITRKVEPGMSSDQVLIRLRPVSCVEGIVRMASRRRGRAPVWGAEVLVAYQLGDRSQVVGTKTDTEGRFFVNLPSGRRTGQAKVIATHRGMIAAEETRAPTRRPLELELRQNFLNGELVLSDKSPLSGVQVTGSYFFPDNRAPNNAQRLPGSGAMTNARGRFFMALAENQRIELTFHLPDGEHIAKMYNTRRLLGNRAIFIYDPVAHDILDDMGGSGGQDAGRRPQDDRSGRRGRQQEGQRNRPPQQPAGTTP